MSLNWVMLSPDKKNFTPLPGRESFAIDCNGGTLYLTNRRVLYIPNTSSDKFQSFACPILNLHDTHVTVPWFGANTWMAIVQPVPGGNLPPPSSGSSSSSSSAAGAGAAAAIELKIAFKDGGAFDFHSKFEQIRERVVQAAETNAAGAGAGAAATGILSSGDAWSSVHLDELPAYEPAAVTAASSSGTAPPSAITAASDNGGQDESRTQEPRVQEQADVHPEEQTPIWQRRDMTVPMPMPSDAPPGYEEATSG